MTNYIGSREAVGMEEPTTWDKVVELLNDAALESNADERISHLKCIQELIVHRQPDLLDNFLDEVLAFQSDPSANVKKWVVDFVEVACRKDPDSLPKTLATLNHLMADENIAVVKKTIVCLGTLYSLAFAWIAKDFDSASASQTNIMTECWGYLCQIKKTIASLLNAANDGIRTHCVKFFEFVVLTESSFRSGVDEKVVIDEEDLDETANGPSLDLLMSSNKSRNDPSSKLAAGLSEEDHPVFDVDDLRADGDKVFGTILDLLGGPESSVQLITAVVSSIVRVCIARPQTLRFNRVVTAMESLQSNLPPDLANFQLQSLKKHLKSQLVRVLKAAGHCPQTVRTRIVTLLTDLEMPPSEIAKVLSSMQKQPSLPTLTPSTAMVKPQATKEVDSNVETEKAKDALIDIPIPESSAVPENGVSGTTGVDTTVLAMETEDEASAAISTSVASLATDTPVPNEDDGEYREETLRRDGGQARSSETAVDRLAKQLFLALTPENVTDLVLLTMVYLPPEMPSNFKSVYSPISDAGSESQKQHLARLLAVQCLHSVGLKPHEALDDAAADIEKKAKELHKTLVPGSLGGQKPDNAPALKDPRLKEESDHFAVTNTTPRQHKRLDADTATNKDFKLPQLGMSKPRSRKRRFRLDEVTKQLSLEDETDLAKMLFLRLISDKNPSDLKPQEQKALCALTTMMPNSSPISFFMHEQMYSFVAKDIRSGFELAQSWLYHEYVNCKKNAKQAQKLCLKMSNSELFLRYDGTLTNLMSVLATHSSLHVRTTLFTRLILEAPLLTDNSLKLINEYCLNEATAFFGVSAIKELCLQRERLRESLVHILLRLCLSIHSDIRQHTVRVLISLMKTGSSNGNERWQALVDEIEQHAVKSLRWLLESSPPPEIAMHDDAPDSATWNADLVKACIHLFLVILPISPHVMTHLTEVYQSPNVSAESKRLILRLLENPVKQMGPDSEALLGLIEQCPEGTESLIIRIGHILVPLGQAPSTKLISMMFDLFIRKERDVRFLLPVMSGLSKQQVIDEVLPSIVALSDPSILECYNRLLTPVTRSIPALTPNQPPTDVRKSLFSPVELLVQLHIVKNDLKHIIRAIKLLTSQEDVARFDADMMAFVLQQLVNLTPLPTLLMRTVIQTLFAYPNLKPVIITMLWKLVHRQVWENDKLWEGFLICCFRLAPKSFEILLGLPPVKLKEILHGQSKPMKDLQNGLRSFYISMDPVRKATLQNAKQIADAFTSKPSEKRKTDENDPSIPQKKPSTTDQ